MKILVTGAGGFIGGHLVEHQLRRGYRVCALDLDTANLARLATEPGLETVTGDVTDEAHLRALMAGVDVVYHLAAAHLDVSLTDEDYWRVNVTATAALLEAARAEGVSRVVHCSSNSVLGELRELPADENTPCHPTNIYEETKLAGEQVAQKFAHDTGLAVAIARPAWVYGPRCPRTARLIRTIGSGRFVMFGDGRTLRHPIYISDALHGLERCAEAAAAPGEVYFLAGPEVVTIKTLVNAVAERQDVPPPRLALPLALGKLAGVGVQTAFSLIGKRPPFSRRSLDFFMKDNAYDISKAKNELGFRPRVNLDAGLTETLRWLNDRNAVRAR